MVSRLRAAALAATLGVAASPCAAQVTSCGMELGKWVCRTAAPQQQPDIVGAGMRAYQQSYDQQRRIQEDAAARRAAAADRYQQMDAERAAAVQTDARQRVAEALRSGQCDAAKEIALRAGDLDLAEQARRLCSN